MKSMRFSILIVALLLSPLCAVWGQSTVSVVNNTKSDTTIVRYWQDGISVVYTHNADNNNWFLLVDTTVPHVRRIAVPSDVTVNDFRILHDRVYVGGHQVDFSGHQRGLLAFFDIQDFYTGAGNYNWMVTLMTSMIDCYFGGCHNQIYDITRLAVFDDVQVGTKIAYIGKNYINGETIMRVGIGCATYYMGLWQGCIIYNKYAVEEYTDIIATQNYVAAVARTNDSGRLAMRIFPKSAFIQMTQVPYWPPGTYYYINKYGQGLADLEVDENVMATALNDDDFAVAYHYTNSPKEGLAVKTFSIVGGTAYLQQSLIVPAVRQVGSTWKMRDVRYSSSLDYIMVLNDFDGGTVGSQTSIVYQFPLPLSASTYWGRYLAGDDLHAIDTFNASSDAYIASGNIPGGSYVRLYWEHLNSETSCGQADVISGKHTTTPLYSTYMETNINEPQTMSGQTPFVVDEEERDVTCNNQP